MGDGGKHDHDNLGQAYNAAAQIESAPDPLAHLSAAERRFVENPDVADALKHLFLEIIPAKDFTAFTRALTRGDYDAHLHCPHNAMGGVLAQVAAMPKDEGLSWLYALANHAGFDESALRVPYYSNGNAYVSTIKGFGDQNVAHQVLGARLLSHYGQKYLDIAEHAPRLLAHDDRTNDITQPIAHHMVFGEKISISRMIAIAEKCGGLDFADIKNSNGESVFYRLATKKEWYNNVDILNSVSWLLERNPALVHTTDDAGWTVLDRYVLQMTTQAGGAPAVAAESGMLRLLMASGAQLVKQSPPGLSVLEYHQQQGDRLALRKPVIAPKPR